MKTFRHTKWVKFIAALMISALFATIVLAAEKQSQYIEEHEITVTAPENFNLITQNSSKDIPFFEGDEVYYQETMDYLYESGISFIAVSPDEDYEIYCRIWPDENNKPNFKDCTKDELREIIDQQTKEFEDTDSTVSETLVYDHTQSPFIVHAVVLNSDEEDYEVIFAQTILNGKQYVVTLTAYGEELTSYMQDKIFQVVDGINFENEKQPPNPDFELQKEIILVLIILAAFYSGPIFIYRFFIKRESVDKITAVKIAVSYASCIYLLESVIVNYIGYGTLSLWAFVWAIINWFILISGSKNASNRLETYNPKSETRSWQDVELANENKIKALYSEETKVCTICKAPYAKGTKICENCGAKLRLQSKK